jgi:hypothetical protein
MPHARPQHRHCPHRRNPFRPLGLLHVHINEAKAAAKQAPSWFVVRAHQTSSPGGSWVLGGRGGEPNANAYAYAYCILQSRNHNDG